MFINRPQSPNEIAGFLHVIKELMSLERRLNAMGLSDAMKWSCSATEYFTHALFTFQEINMLKFHVKI